MDPELDKSKTQTNNNVKRYIGGLLKYQFDALWAKISLSWAGDSLFSISW